MSLAAQTRSLLGQSAAMRQDMFGTRPDGTRVTANYNGGEFPALPGYYSPIKTRQQTEQAGFFDVHDSIFRVIKASVPTFTPAIDAVVRIVEGENEIVLRVDEIAGGHPLSAEWVLGCKAQN